MPNWRRAAGSSGARLRTSRYPLSALPYSPAAKASLARDRSWSLVGRSLEQPAVATATRESANINGRDRGAMLVIVKVIEVLPIYSNWSRSAQQFAPLVRALAPGAG